jgi:hypothetical protein
MTGIVSVPDYEPWQVAGWYFQLLIDRAGELSQQAADRDEFEQAGHFQHLSFKNVAAERAPLLARTLIIAAGQIRSELVEHGTVPRDRQVADHLLELLAILKSAFGDS